MKRKWIALVLSVSVLGRNGSCSCICFGDAAGDLGDAGSGNTSGSYACRDGFRGGELCSGWTERQLSASADRH